MDKLRALQYFVAAAQEGSLSAAARSLGVSVPAVAKLIGALERQIGAVLFERTAHGLLLTADGERYRDACEPVLAQLAQADEAVAGGMVSVRGPLVIGSPPQLAQHCILPALPRLHARYPELQFDMRLFNTLLEMNPQAIDVIVTLGWPQQGGMVQRRIAQTRQLICAAPAYWAARGVPERPRDLDRHVCLLLRNPLGTLLDLWEFQREGEAESVVASGWLHSNHRDAVLDAALAGAGVVRVTDLTVREHLRSGRLVPVLQEWVIQGAPPVNLMYRPNQRRSPRARVFIEFVTQLFRDLEAERDTGAHAGFSAQRPAWHARQYPRASAALRGRK